jgi:dTDP-L-rhamnose 4-epimerase
MKRILITGGAGFIGTHLCRLALGSGHRVTILDNLSPQVHGQAGGSFEPPVGASFIRGDVTLRNDLERAVRGVDTIVHLAAETGTGQSMYEIDRYYRVNVQGTALLFDVLSNTRHEVSNVVLASSRSVYGEGAYLCFTCNPEGSRCFPDPRSPQQLAASDWSPRCRECGDPVQPTATRETDRLSPASIYATTKLAQEHLVGVACRAQGLAHTILRFQTVFGEGQSLTNPYTGILSIFSTRLRLGLPLPIFEDGEETRDFIHVADVADAALRSVEHPNDAGLTVNVGSGQPTSILSVASLLCRTMDVTNDLEITGQYRVGDIRHNFADMSLIDKAMGFRPKVSLDDGMRRFCDWIATQPVPQDLLEKANSELRERKLLG